MQQGQSAVCERVPMKYFDAGKLYGKINWRINKRDNDFIERNTVQTFRQVFSHPHTLSKQT